MSLPPDFVAELRRSFGGDIRLDLGSRILYSTDASIYQIEPLGVAIPKNQEDLQAAVEMAARYRVPILPRGAGTSLAGQAIGPALILDCSRWLDHILDIDPAARTATVEPGVVLDDLNRAAAIHGLQFGPDPASAERATMAGVVANNGTGAHSIRYGMAADHLRSAEVLLSDGSIATLGEVRVGERVQANESDLGIRAMAARGAASRYEALLETAKDLRAGLTEDIRAHYPASWRNSAGYRLNYLLGWSPSAPPEWVGTRYPADLKPDTINLAHLLAGSEGTLAVIRKIRIGLVPKPLHTILGILQYPTLGAACDAVPVLLNQHPSAIELIPQLLLRIARDVPASAGRMHWVRGDPEAVVVIEYSGDDIGRLRTQAEALPGELLILESAVDQANVWGVRKIGLGLLDSRPQPARPISFVEDCAIPVENLGAYVRGMERIMAEYDALGGIYGHASAGCLHIRPVLDLRLASGRRALRSIAEATASLALGLGGSMTSEHGDGIARAEWLGQTYNDRIDDAMRTLKSAVDPNGILNPGKKIDAPPFDSNLRYGPEHQRLAWRPGLGFERQGGLTLAIERCNGQGVCRKSSGVMCPSFQATREEMHSTRGRANLLRALIATGLPRELSADRPSLDPRVLSPELVSLTFEALDLCLACKGCTAECPSGVDMPELKSEFLRFYYGSHRRPLRDYLFGYFHLTARLLSAVGPAIDAASRLEALSWIVARVLRIAPQRPLPRFARGPVGARRRPGRPEVLFLRDPFNHYVDRGVEQAALDLLYAAGADVHILDSMGAGASLISKGFLHSARRHAEQLVAELAKADPSRACPVVAIEPSELSALRHEYAALVPALDPRDRERLEKTQSVEEYLTGIPGLLKLRVAIINNKVTLHTHCHQKADNAASGRASAEQDPSVRFLQSLNFAVDLIEAGCCGMAGTFGYEAEHYELSQKIGESELFRKIRESAGTAVAATGAACRMQIAQGTGVKAEHPLVLAARALGLAN
jgi:FAD/FMN-containing dehydrogenase/Fe-S oxidoreductase